MSKTRTAAWGPTARNVEPHAFETDAVAPRWCKHCNYSEDAYQHASAEERAVFDEQQAAEAARRSEWRDRVGRRSAEIEERDYIVHALADQPGFILEQLTVAPAPVSFRYFRGGRLVSVTVSVEGTTS